jgi:hypothetical protein
MVYWYKHDRLHSVEIAYLVLLPLLIVTSNKLTTIINKSDFWLVILYLTWGKELINYYFICKTNSGKSLIVFLGIVIALTGSMEETNVGEDLNLKRKTVLHQNAQSIVS